MTKHNTIFIGPFVQLLTMDNLPKTGLINDGSLEIIHNAGILIKNGFIDEIGPFESLQQKAIAENYWIEEITAPLVAMPGLIDCHTHICYAGNRRNDYAARLQNVSYLEIAKRGGGIMDTVRATRKASTDELIHTLRERTTALLHDGITTCEVKSGYGLSTKDELKMLEVITEVSNTHPMDIISTCLAAHVCPPEFSSLKKYLTHVSDELLPEIARQQLAKRVDIFIESTAFSKTEAKAYLHRAKEIGFSIVIHADQFTVSGSQLAAECGALSADHLEVTTEKEMKELASQNVIGIVLPGASIGLGLPFAKAKEMMKQGMQIAIASDYNPGSAPMGDLLIQASILGAFEKLTIAETLAALTVRAAQALECSDRGILKTGFQADMIAFPCDDYKEIMYRQGKMKPAKVWKKGLLIK